MIVFLAKLKQTKLVVVRVYLTSQCVKFDVLTLILPPEKTTASFRLEYMTTNIMIELFQILNFLEPSPARMFLKPLKNSLVNFNPKKQKISISSEIASNLESLWTIK